MSFVTTHVLDGSRGVPASGVTVTMTDADHAVVAQGVTDDDGRVPSFGPDQLPSGTYHVTFGTGDYFSAAGIPTFYPSVTITVAIDSSAAHYHVPLLLSPFAYSTYRGS
ncbi:MAG: hydroxyisourate hydrolase [Micropruina sp.]|uniref:hydroxyisourate hydrolase n=1 Tax=Micropruina sp. TaxID=2737536 RepID=UPI0039E43B3C